MNYFFISASLFFIIIICCIYYIQLFLHMSFLPCFVSCFGFVLRNTWCYIAMYEMFCMNKVEMRWRTGKQQMIKGDRSRTAGPVSSYVLIISHTLTPSRGVCPAPAVPMLCPDVNPKPLSRIIICCCGISSVEVDALWTPPTGAFSVRRCRLRRFF